MSPTNCVPPRNGKYKAPTDQIRNAHYRNGGKDLNNQSHKPYRNMKPPPPGDPPKDEFFLSTLSGAFSTDGGATFSGFAVQATSTVHIAFSGTMGSTLVWSNRLTQLDAAAPGSPVKVRVSPTLPSLGRTTITPAPGGYLITSYFDVYTEVSTDGGATWLPSIDPGTGLPESRRVELVDGAPEYPFASDAAPPPGVVFASPRTAGPINFPAPTLAAAGEQARPDCVVGRNFQHSGLINPIPLPAPGQSAVYQATGTRLNFEVSLDGTNFSQVHAQANTSLRITHTGDSADTRFFDTELLSLDLTGGNLPPGVMLRESPTRPSLGDHAVRTVQGGFMVSSTIDVELELSLDGGTTWRAADRPAQVDMGFPAPIPTVSEWGLIVLGLLLLTVGGVFIFRRRLLATAGA